MRNHSFLLFLLFTAAILIVLPGCGKEEATQTVFRAAVSVDAAPNALSNVSVALPEGVTRETVSTVQHDFILDGKQIGGIALVDIPKELLDSPREGLFDIAELLRQQLMPDIPAEDVEVMSCGGNQNAYMELTTGPDEIVYFHYLFRGINNTYDVWFNWNLLDQDSDLIYETISSVTGEDILPENNENPF